MRILDPSEHTPSDVDAVGTIRFEAFLDRNYPGWREREQFAEKNAGTVERSWAVGVDDLERHALFRGEYVEIYDECFEADGEDDFLVHTPQHRICAIDGDTTSVAVWGKRSHRPV